MPSGAMRMWIWAIRSDQLNKAQILSHIHPFTDYLSLVFDYLLVQTAFLERSGLDKRFLLDVVL